MKRFVQAVICIISAAFCLWECSDRQHPKQLSSEHESLVSEIKRLSRARKTDSLFKLTRPLFYAATGAIDTMTRLYAGVYNLEEYCYTENIDSAKVYMEALAPMEDIIADSPLGGVYYMVAAFYEFKANRDFPVGVELLSKSYEKFRKDGNTENMIGALANLVQFFYIRSDTQGLEYAQKAYAEASAIKDGVWYKCIASLSMAQMLSLSDRPEDAAYYISETDSLLRAGNYKVLYYTIPLLKADLQKQKGNYIAADSLYRKALNLSRNEADEPSSVMQICLKYGDLHRLRKDYSNAISIYRKGIKISEETKNTVFLDNLLLNIAECSIMAGKKEEAINYYARYIKLQDSLSVSKRDREVIRLTQNYSQMSHKLEIQKKEMDLLKANRRIVITALCLVIFIILSLSFIIINRRQKKMYGILVEQYRTYMQRTENTPSKEANDASRDLWQKIEALMQNEKLYRQKDLTLEKLAEAAGTNRTYLSKTINIFSKVNFTNYIDKYRIKESVKIIESSEKNIPFKQIADIVGYNTISVFYKAFSKETGLSPGKYRDEILRRKHYISA